MVDEKVRTDVYLLSVGTGDIATPEKRIPRNKRNTKSPAMLPTTKDPMKNQYINRLTTKKDQSIPPHLAKFPPGFKLLINEAHYNNSTEYNRNDSTYPLRNDKENP